MKLFLVITLLLLSTLLYEAQGINRKLMTKTIFTATTSTTAITAKNHKDDLKMGTKSTPENFAVSLSSKHLNYGKAEATPPGYAEVVDLTGMDYSPARRKPPIHN